MNKFIILIAVCSILYEFVSGQWMLILAFMCFYSLATHYAIQPNMAVIGSLVSVQLFALLFLRNGLEGLETKEGDPEELEEKQADIAMEDPKINYASTMENAYAELNDLLGKDGIKNLTADTQRLVKQQMGLAESMKSMTPLIQSMAPMLKNLQGIIGPSK